MKHANPPKWFSNALATDKGWVNPKTGELLISVKGLKLQQDVDSEKVEQLNEPEEIKESANEKVEQYVSTTEEVASQEVANVEEKPKRGRPSRKNQEETIENS